MFNRSGDGVIGDSQSQNMLASRLAAPIRLPAHRCFSSCQPGRSAQGAASALPGPSGGRSRGGATAVLQSWYTDDRRRLLQALGVGIIGASMFGRSSTALAASRVEQVGAVWNAPPQKLGVRGMGA